MGEETNEPQIWTSRLEKRNDLRIQDEASSESTKGQEEEFILDF